MLSAGKRIVRNLLEGAMGNRLGVGSYSQQGEDAILRCLMSDKAHGFFVDVGAHHPRRFSNTYMFYRRGWRGLNLDATPGSMKAFRAERPRDINLECAIGTSSGPLTFYLFNEPALNSFSPEMPPELASTGLYRVVQEIKIVPRRLDDVVKERLRTDQAIDFMTVDVEGHDIDVLSSNDWDRFRPGLLVAEDNHALRWSEAAASPLTRFMTDRSYVLCAKTMHTLVFLDEGRINSSGELRF